MQCPLQTTKCGNFYRMTVLTFMPVSLMLSQIYCAFRCKSRFVRSGQTASFTLTYNHPNSTVRFGGKHLTLIQLTIYRAYWFFYAKGPSLFQIIYEILKIISNCYDFLILNLISVISNQLIVWDLLSDWLYACIWKASISRNMIMFKKLPSCKVNWFIGCA